MLSFYILFHKEVAIPCLLMYDQELRDISMKEGLKGKHFFLESDIKGPNLKLDNTGKAILTVSTSSKLLYPRNLWVIRVGVYEIDGVSLLRPKSYCLAYSSLYIINTMKSKLGLCELLPLALFVAFCTGSATSWSDQ